MRRGKTTLSLFLPICNEPTCDASIGDCCLSEFLEMGEDLCPRLFPGSFACVVEIICDGERSMVTADLGSKA